MAIFTGAAGTTDWYYIKHTHFGYPDDVVASNWDTSPNVPADYSDISITSNYTVVNGSGTFNSLSLGTGASLTMSGGYGSFSVSSIANGGSINVALSALVLRGSAATLTGGGTITLQANDPQHNGVDFGHDDGANLVLTNMDNTINGGGSISGYRSGSLTLINYGTINATGNSANQYGALNVAASGGVTNHALIEATGSAGLGISSNIDNRDGRILALDGSHATLSGTITGGIVSATGSGYIDANGATFDGSSGGIALSGTVNAPGATLRGAISNAGVIDVGVSQFLYTDGPNTTLSGGGNVHLRANAPQHYPSAIVGSQSAPSTLTNVDNTISGGGSIEDYRNNALTFINHGTISATGDSSNNYGALSIGNTGGLTNDGTLQAVSAGSTLAIATGRTVINNGLMSASNGGSLTVADAVSGTGSVQISGGSTASFSSSFGENVAFLAANAGTLVVSQPYSGTISGLDHGNIIDFSNISYSSSLHVSLSAFNNGDQVSIVDASGNIISTVNLAGSYAAGEINLLRDANGHLELTASSHLYQNNQQLFGVVTSDPHSSGGETYALYEGLLGRAPDAAGLEYWADQFDHGASPATLASGFLGSPEGQMRLGAADNNGFVQQLYHNTLHRDADQGGLDYWTGQLAHGESRTDVADSFVFSPEFTTTVQQMLGNGLFVPDAQASEVARIYYTMLGRAPDAGGLQYWTDQIDHGGSPSSVAQSFLSTPESQSTYGRLNNHDYVDALYVNALGRHADKGGSDFWTGQLDHGTSRADLAVQLSQSPESQSFHFNQVELGWHLT